MTSRHPCNFLTLYNLVVSVHINKCHHTVLVMRLRVPVCFGVWHGGPLTECVANLHHWPYILYAELQRSGLGRETWYRCTLRFPRLQTQIFSRESLHFLNLPAPHPSDLSEPRSSSSFLPSARWSCDHNLPKYMDYTWIPGFDYVGYAWNLVQSQLELNEANGSISKLVVSNSRHVSSEPLWMLSYKMCWNATHDSLFYIWFH